MKGDGAMERYKILYEDETLFVLWKAAGIPVQSARASVPDVMHLLQNRLLEEESKELRLFLINRLDQPVEGLFLVARQEKAAAELNRQVSGRTHMEKWYQALVCGKPPKEKGTLVDYLLKDGRTNTSRVVPAGMKGAKRCELSYEVIQEWEHRSLLRICLLTGRHHQIRVQLAHAGVPIAGDRKYGKADAGEEKLSLCACKICFTHPKTGEQMQYQVESTFLLPGADRGKKGL